jgi:hypothetical protein
MKMSGTRVASNKMRLMNVDRIPARRKMCTGRPCASKSARYLCSASILCRMLGLEPRSSLLHKQDTPSQRLGRCPCTGNRKSLEFQVSKQSYSHDPY